MRKRSRLNRKIKYYDIFDESAPKTDEINETFSKLKKCTETRTEQTSVFVKCGKAREKQDTHTIIRKWSTRDKYYLVICLLRFFPSHECMFVVDTKEFNKSRKMYGQEMKRKEKKGDNGQRWWAWKWWDSQESFDSGYHNCLPLNWFNWKFVQMKCMHLKLDFGCGCCCCCWRWLWWWPLFGAMVVFSFTTTESSNRQHCL